MHPILVGLGTLISVASITSGMPSLPYPPVPPIPAALPSPPWSIRKRADEKVERNISGAPLSPADFENAVTLDLPQFESSPENVDPVVLAALFEGDIIVQKNGRNAINDNNKKWSNGIVPYILSDSYNKQERATIARAIKAFHDNTCLRFIPRTTEQDYIHILKGDGCSSSVGRVDGEQALSLGVGCIYTGVVMHELMHVVGFWHEHSRKDRDHYITINWLNIQDGMEWNFKKHNTSQDFGLEYDTGSIMHFGQYVFAKDRSQPTIIPHKKGVDIGQRTAFSKTDIRKLNILYECPGVDNSDGGNSIVTAMPLKPKKRTLAASQAVQEIRASDATIDNDAMVSDWQNINIPIWAVESIKKDIPGESLSPADFENAVKISSNTQVEPGWEFLDHDPIELASLFEGDIIINSMSDVPQQTQRNAMTDLKKKWPKGVVPYVISGSYNKQERGTIAIAIKKYQELTCLRFVPRTSQRDYIHILKADGCSSSVGRVGGAQAVSLGRGCMYAGIVMHELMHAVGFWHEQSREDRDSYITINWSNIQAGMDFNFKKFTQGTIQGLGVSYDTGSIMHYGKYAFAKDRSTPTIIPHKSGVEIGQRRAFSETDIKKLNIFYECSGVDNSGGGNSIVTPAPVKPPKPPQPNSCVDNNQYCSEWARGNECKKNSAWMNINCKKSCKQCGTPCKDQSDHCKYWKNNGECTKNSEYMMLFCKQSCGACHGKDEHVVCGNQNKHCETWASLSQCRSNPEYMLLYCSKACGQC